MKVTYRNSLTTLAWVISSIPSLAVAALSIPSANDTERAAIVNATAYEIANVDRQFLVGDTYYPLNRDLGMAARQDGVGCHGAQLSADVSPSAHAHGVNPDPGRNDAEHGGGAPDLRSAELPFLRRYGTRISWWSDPLLSNSPYDQSMAFGASGPMRYIYAEFSNTSMN